MEKIQLPEGIQQHLENDVVVPISLENQEELLLKVKAHTGLSTDILKIIITQIFQEIRTNIIKGNSVKLRHFGKLSYKKCGFSFRTADKLIQKINND